MWNLARWAIKCALLPYGALARERRPGVTVLAYHRVGGGTGGQIDLPVTLFDWQMGYLSERCRVISLDEVAAAARDGTDGPEAVAITFDDGYADLYQQAFPILRRHRLPATVYLATQFMEEGVLKGGRGQGGASEARPLTWAQAAEMAGSGLITIGAHTHHHADLGLLPGEKVEEELDAADSLIEARLGVRPAHFSYPWGRFTSAAQICAARRYRTVAVGGVRKNPYGAIDVTMLRRTPVLRSDGRVFFRLKLGSYLVGEEWIRARADDRSARRAGRALVT